MADLLYLDDLAIGRRFDSATKVVDESEITSFAKSFDPQPFHLDRETAASSRFGGLVASGWHTGAITMRLLVDSEFRIAGGIVGTGFDEFRWITPVRPGDTLHLETEVVDVRRSTRKPTQSLVKVRITTLNQNMEPVQILLANLAVPSRSASSTPCERELNKGNTTMAAIEQIDELKNQALTQQEAAAILARYQELWNRGALPELLEGFTDDITVEFADLPTIKGKRELGQIIRARLARQMHYRLKKTLRFVSGNTIVGSWVADWTDGATGRPMKGKGIEFIEMRDGKCARWEATFNAWDAEAPSRSQFT